MSRVTCARCSVGYDPGLTGHRCPVCDAPVPGAPEERPARDRLLTIVLVAAVLNVTLLVALAVAVARAS